MKDLHINLLLLEHVALHISRGGQLMKLNFSCLSFVLTAAGQGHDPSPFSSPPPKQEKKRKKL